MDITAETWLPPHFPRVDEVVGYLLLMNLPSGAAIRLSDSFGDTPALRVWMHGWLTPRAAQLDASQSTECETDVSFLCLAARRSGTEEARFALSSFAYGVFPAAPGDWVVTTPVDLLQRAIASLGLPDPFDALS